MKCPFPRTYGRKEFPCHKCEVCLKKKKRFWAGRILLEAAYAPLRSSFVTLTYNPDHYPKNGLLDVSELQRYLKRLRNGSLGAIRYFAVGEYGENKAGVEYEQGGRPHYHLVLFGMPPDTWEDYVVRKWSDQDDNPIGFVSVSELTPERAMYIAQYCVKKINNDAYDDETPEFATMSKNPPLGAAGMRKILDLLYTSTGSKAMATQKDVPSHFEMHGSHWPIGSYWRNWLRDELGMGPPPEPPHWVISEYKASKEYEYEQKKARQQHDYLFKKKRQKNARKGVL